MQLLITGILLMLTTVSYGQWEKKYTQMGNDSLQRENFTDADSLYQLALGINPEYTPAAYNRAILQYKKGEIANAELAFSDLIDRVQDSLQSHCHYNRGNCRIRSWFAQDLEIERLDEEIVATEDNEKASVKSRMENYVLRDSLLKVHQELLQERDRTLQGALEDYKQTIRLNPDDDQARYNLMYARALLPIPEVEKEKQKEKQKKQDKNEESAFVKKTYEQVMKLIEENKFKEAHTLMQSASQQDPGMQKYQKLMQKLEVLSKILSE